MRSVNPLVTVTAQALHLASGRSVAVVETDDHRISWPDFTVTAWYGDNQHHDPTPGVEQARAVLREYTHPLLDFRDFTDDDLILSDAVCEQLGVWLRIRVGSNARNAVNADGFTAISRFLFVDAALDREPLEALAAARNLRSARHAARSHW